MSEPVSPHWAAAKASRLDLTDLLGAVMQNMGSERGDAVTGHPTGEEQARRNRDNEAPA